ncbi:MAG TPA: 50S ribosomal protein L10, partial [Saprospiraceae bacterium]|nr:50S ribosomal protein L10 [Saprospiraceae bacterium]
MTKDEKTVVIETLKEKFDNSSFFYLTDSSTLTVVEINELRGLFYEKGIEMKVVKNTLAQKALESLSEEKGFSGLYDSLKGPTSVLFTDTANAPARIIEEFRKTHERPLIKAAYIDT